MNHFEVEKIRSLECVWHGRLSHFLLLARGGIAIALRVAPLARVLEEREPRRGLQRFVSVLPALRGVGPPANPQ